MGGVAGFPPYFGNTVLALMLRALTLAIGLHLQCFISSFSA